MNFNFIFRAQSLRLKAAVTVATEDSRVTSHTKKKIMVVWTSLTFHFDHVSSVVTSVIGYLKTSLT